MRSDYKIGYARVSSLEQDEALQRDALNNAGCERIYVDKASGTLERRPALDSMLEQLRPGTRSSSGGWTASAARYAI
jgi:DNA invertase Pin-like site-specific DNA recombinase